jgi:general secretion pathway protein E/type IV pilus assembly protein PilB
LSSLETTDHIPLSLEQQQLVNSDQAWYFGIIPKAATKSSIEFYIDPDKLRSDLPDELEVLFGKTVMLEKSDPTLIKKTLAKYYRKNEGTSTNRKNINVKSDEFLHSLVSEARELGSSDIHIEIYDDKCRIRFRIDGMLIERHALSKSEYPTAVNKIKISANCEISEKRLPQDGRIQLFWNGNKIDIRVSILPTLHGEKIVLRLLSNDAANIDIRKLGFSDLQLEHYLEGVKKPHGIVLISGPTGSGKTTTLYATLKLLNKTTNNILTIEDPVEYTLEGINQVQLKEDIGLSFAAALRTFLRQDPDVIMLGEIRDGETAQMAIRASLTGHLVLSTIHTNSAWGTIARLADMGVPPFLIASTLNLSVAQRLVRLLCTICKEAKPFESLYLPNTYIAPKKLDTLYHATGCEHCHYTGYKGRKALYEVIPVDMHLAESIKNNTFTISGYLKSRNISSLSDNAFELLSSGVTSAEEVYTLLVNEY